MATVMASMMASVSGTLTVTVVPSPALDERSMVPPSAWIFRLATSIPTPRPDRSVTCSAVENPGSKISCQTSASGASGAMARLQPEHADRRFAGCFTHLRRFQSMVDGVAYQMGQRIGNLLDQPTVQFGGFAEELQLHALAEPRGEFVHQAWKAREH